MNINQAFHLIPSKGRPDYLFRTVQNLKLIGISSENIVISIENEELNSYANYFLEKHETLFEYQVVRLVETNKGVGYARNKLISFVNNFNPVPREYIFMYDDDLIVDKQNLERMLEICSGKDTIVCSTFSSKIFEFYDKSKIELAAKNGNDFYEEDGMFKFWCAKTEIFKVVNYDEELKLYEDLDICYRVFMEFPRKKMMIYAKTFIKDFGGQSIKEDRKGGCSSFFNLQTALASIERMKTKNYSEFFTVRWKPKESYFKKYLIENAIFIDENSYEITRNSYDSYEKFLLDVSALCKIPREHIPKPVPKFRRVAMKKARMGKNDN